MSSAGQREIEIEGGRVPVLRWALYLVAAIVISVALGFAVGLARPRVKSLSA